MEMLIRRRQSLAVSKRVSNFLHQAASQWRENSTAPVSSQTTEVKKVRKRLSKNERQAMMESFVCKYREANSGRFPTVSDAVKKVGGSYYVIRSIMQELKYKSTLPPSNIRNDFFPGKEVAVVVTSIKMEEVSNNQVSVNRKFHEYAAQVMNEASSKINVVKRKKSTNVEKIKSSSVAMIGDINKGTEPSYATSLKEASEDLHPWLDKPVETLKMKKPSRGIPDSGGQKPPNKERQTYSSKAVKLDRDVPKDPADNVEHQKQPSFWQNLKSLADGVINIWRKL